MKYTTGLFAFMLFCFPLFAQNNWKKSVESRSLKTLERYTRDIALTAVQRDSIKTLATCFLNQSDSIEAQKELPLSEKIEQIKASNKTFETSVMSLLSDSQKSQLNRKNTLRNQEVTNANKNSSNSN